MFDIRNLSHIVAAAIAPLVWLTLPLRADDWPQWRGPQRDAVWNEKGIMETFPADGLKISWKAHIGRGWSSPVVAAGRVYLTDVEIGQPQVKERVLCFDAATGKPLWTHKYVAEYPDWALAPGSGGPRATPIINDGKIYTLGALGQLFCLDAVTGAVIWEKNGAKEYEMKEFSGITASPLIDGDRLILYICGKPAACVVAFDKNTGKELWRALDDAFSYSSPIVLTAGGQKQLIIWTQEAVTSLDPTTGKTWWREELRTPGDQAISTPVFSNDRLLIAGLMLKLDPEKPAATVLWPKGKLADKRVLSNTSTPLLQGDYLYSAKTTGDLVCMEAATGNLVWQTDKITSLKNGSSIHITVNGESAMLFTDQGNLIRATLKPDGYHELSRTHLIDPTHSFNGRQVVWAPAAFANRSVFARSDKELVCASLAAKTDP